MPLHDWTKVKAYVFAGFHTRWIGTLTIGLNNGILPTGYYADSEQIKTVRRPDRRSRPDVLALKRPALLFDTLTDPSAGTAVADAPPAARRMTFEVAPVPRRHVVVRHASGHRVVALIEIVSRANKDRPARVEAFAGRVAAALAGDIQVLVLDLFPPGRSDPNGLHEAVIQQFGSDTYTLPSAEARTFASYTGGPGDAFLEHPAIGAALPAVPLFLGPDRYVNVPLEPSYQLAYSGTPDIWREVLEHPTSSANPSPP